MKVLVIGAAGYVAGIVRPALESLHECSYLDTRPVSPTSVPHQRLFQGSVNDDDVLKQALENQDAVIYLAMGVKPGTPTDGPLKNVDDIDNVFDVNVKGLYRSLYFALQTGVRRFIYTSSINVYHKGFQQTDILDENVPTGAWYPYGISKRLGEFLCQAAAEHYNDATIIALRLLLPLNDADWQADVKLPVRKHPHRQGPQDMRRLILASLQCNTPGCHVLLTTGDLRGQRFSNRKAAELLQWIPTGE